MSLQPHASGPVLTVRPTAPGMPPLTLTAAQVGWPERWSANRLPRQVVVDLREHGSLEIDDAPAWQTAVHAAGVRPALAQRMQTRWPVFLGVLVLAAIAVGAFYRWGTPWAAAQLARHVPLAWETELTARALTQMDKSPLKPSKLGTERQAQLTARFDQLTSGMPPGLSRYRGYAPRMNLLFRSGLGANAFALPGGTVVLGDGLVEAAAKPGLGDDAIVGVLAHEIGHALHRHTTRMVVEQGVLNVGLGLALGDVSSLVSMGSSLLTGLAYRRNHEAEADCFAMALMRHAQLPTEPVADLLLVLADTRDGKRNTDKPRTSTEGALTNLLSSHPQTALRAQRLKQGKSEGC